MTPRQVEIKRNGVKTLKIIIFEDSNMELGYQLLIMYNRANFVDGTTRKQHQMVLLLH